jgi:hypothetical protein
LNLSSRCEEENVGAENIEIDGDTADNYPRVISHDGISEEKHTKEKTP